MRAKYVSIAGLLVAVAGGIMGYRWYKRTYLPDRFEKNMQFTVNKVLSQLSRTQMASQVLHINIPGMAYDAQTESELEKIQPGGVIFFGRNLGKADEVKQLTQQLQTKARELKIPGLLLSADQEGGYVYRMREPVPQFPSATGFGQLGDAQLSEQAGYLVGEALLSVGINVAFAPILDINNNPGNPVIGVRSFGSDMNTVMRAALPYEKGLRASGALSVIKHFPGHGDTLVDSHLGLPRISKTEQEISGFELVPFRNAIQNGAPAVMTAHIIYEKIDPKFPATLSEKILTGILRDKLKFKGLVFTDAMEMHAISKNYQNDKPAVQALLAGADVILLTSWGKTADTMLKEIIAADKAGTFVRTTPQGKKIDILEERVKNQIRTKIEMGLIDLKDISGEHESMAEYLKETRQPQANFLAQIEKKRDTILSEINRKTIRAWPAPFKPVSAKDSARVKFMGGNKIVADVLSARKSFSPRDQAKEISADHIVYYASSAGQFAQARNYAMQNKTKKVVVLFSGKPYVKYAKAPNLTYLLSFSPESTAIKALAESLISDEIEPAAIPVLQLALP